MQAQTHVAINGSILILSSAIFGGPELTLTGIIISTLATLFPDIDSNRSYIGRVVGLIVKVFSVGLIDLGQHLTHRKSLHNPFLSLILIGLVQIYFPDYVGYVMFGLLNHLFSDLFQKEGIHVFRNYWLTFDSDGDMPNQSNAELVLFIFACLPVIGYGLYIVPRGGVDTVIRQLIGTPKCVIEECLEKNDYICDVEIKKALFTSSGAKIEPGNYALIGVEEEKLILKDKTGKLVTLGKDLENTLITLDSCKLILLTQVNIIEFNFRLENMLLSELEHMIDNSCFYFFHGSAIPGEGVKIITKQDQYNPITYKYGQVNFQYCTLEDIAAYDLRDTYIETSDFHLVYKVSKQKPVHLVHPYELYKDKTREHKVPFAFHIEKISDLVILEKDRVKEGQIIAQLSLFNDEIEFLKEKIETGEKKLAALMIEHKAMKDEIREKKIATLAEKSEIDKRLLSIKALNTENKEFYQKYADSNIFFAEFSGGCEKRIGEVQQLLHTRILEKTQELAEGYQKRLKRINADLASLEAAMKNACRRRVFQASGLEQEMSITQDRLEQLQEFSFIRAPASGVVSCIRFYPENPPSVGFDDMTNMVRFGKRNLKVEIVFLSKLVNGKRK